MRLTLDALIVLDAIDRKGSFAAAAEELYRVPSAISYTVQKLEQDLEVTVFDRSGHRAVLTPPGRALLEQGRVLLNNVQQLEAHVQRVATGWEAELRIAIDTLIPVAALFPLCTQFYAAHRGTRLHLSEEVLGGSWDALLAGRADLVIAASGDGPPGGGYSIIPMGEATMVFAVAPAHPLASHDEPLTSAELLKHRAIAVADSSRYLPVRSFGLLQGQDVLTVPDMQAKLEAQCQGLGVGYLPSWWAATAVADGRLLVKTVADTPAQAPLHVAWSNDHQGKALKWFVKMFKKPQILQALVDFPVTLPASATTEQRR